MKKTILMNTFAVALLSTLSLGTILTVDAAEKETKSEATFIEGTTTPVDPDEDLELVKPGTEDPITIKQTQGAATDGALSFEFIPNFDFGKSGNEITALTAKYNVLPTLYSEKDSDDLREISPFLQVIDVRGDKAGYIVKVVQEDVFETEGSGLKLPTTRIELAEQTTTITDSDSAVLTGLDTTEAKDIPVKTDGGSAITVLEGAETKATIGSLVFEKDYDPSTTGLEVVTEATNRVSGVKLRVPTADAPEKDIKYSATLTWSLENVVAP